MLIHEIFFSFQGEGLYIGVPQVFLRLAGCNLICEYCDEVDKPTKELSCDDIINQVTPLYSKKPHSLVLTGGEPLLQVNELKNLIPKINLPIFLETNGTLPEHLMDIMELITYFSVDYKPGHEKEFIDFLSLLKEKDNIYVKYVMLKDFNILELKTLGKIVASINKKIPIILQPVTPVGKIKHRPTPADLFRGYQVLLNQVDTVRIIGQTHKMIGLA
jgi:organic radical activating enzyme